MPYLIVEQRLDLFALAELDEPLETDVDDHVVTDSASWRQTLCQLC